ncbi:MAG: methyltransferase domain-containing protein [Deltaproteobacteria bacterium]|nr:MAG: methyltransferase domain-containing protein [Deltaproteobacteria bacterium]
MEAAAGHALMAWQELQVRVRAGNKGAAAGALHRAGASGVQEDYLPGEAPPPRQPWDTGPPPPDPAEFLLRAWFEDPEVAPIEAAVSPWAESLAWEAVPDVDWEESWKAGFEPLVVSERLVVAPPWDAPEGALIIEPGQGFGTGSHETTRGLLKVVDQLADQVDTVLDVGCGSGVLALAAAKLGCIASGIDVDADAVKDAVAHAERNGLDVPFSQAPVTECAPADLCLANLYAEVLVDLHPELLRCTGRYLGLAGIMLTKEHMVRELYDPDLELLQRDVDGEWVALLYERRA